MAGFRTCNGPDSLLRDHLQLFTSGLKQLPILDLACGDGHNGIFLVRKGFQVVFADRSEEALERVKKWAETENRTVTVWRIDLEAGCSDPLSGRTFSAILVFRYLHRPLIPAIRDALASGGLLFYETFTEQQTRFGKPANPDHLLKPGELRSWFHDWEILHTFEGIVNQPPKAVAQLVCRKP
ncbi:MAG TPA: methyltransferase domain-containing protein [Thermodesulfovibrionales bacterium]|nr:methyltransferase domain-containing protein [Thermodesulfovibrionales bacterium]